MDNFINQVDNSLKNREVAKLYAQTTRYTVEKRIYNEMGSLSCVWLLAFFLLGMLAMYFTSLVSIIPRALWFEIIMWPCFVALFMAAGMWVFITIFKPSADSVKVCLSPNDRDVSATVVVGTIQNCKVLGATNFQLQQLQEAAQDANIPAGWWNWLSNTVEKEEWRLIDQEFEDKEIAAKRKICKGNIL